MRKSVVWLTLSVSLVFAFTGRVFALEVGAVQVRSYLNEPLVATIPVRVDNIQQRDSLSATLAPETEYVARGLQPLAEADDLIVQVVEGGNVEQMLIELRSLSDVNTPYMGLVLQLSWNGGGQVQEFTVFLDPRQNVAQESPAAAEPAMADESSMESSIEPVMEPAMTEEAAPAEPVGLAPPADEVIAPAQPERDEKLEQLAQDMNAAAPQNSAPSMTMPEESGVIIRKVSPDEYLAQTSDDVIIKRRSPAPAEPSSATASKYKGDSYGPVGAGETLWSIATLARPGLDVSMQQVMAAIHAANPQAFDGGYETLKRGATLSIPDEQAIRSTQAQPQRTAMKPKSESKPASTAETSPAPKQSQRTGSEPEDIKAESQSDTVSDEADIWSTASTQAPVDSSEREKKGGLVTKSATAPVKGAAEGDAPTDSGEDASATAGQVDYTALDSAADAEADSTGEPSADAAATDDADSATQAEAQQSGAEGTESEVAGDATADATQDEAGETEAESGEATADEPAEASDSTDVASDNTLKLAGVILIVILLTYWLFRRRRAQDDGGGSGGFSAPVADDDSTDSLGFPQAPDYEDNTVGQPRPVAIAEDPVEEPSASDPVLDQVDTYLSYGLYESAADTLQKAIEDEPNRSDLRMKLLETHEAAGNQDDFVAAAQDWDNSGNPPTESERSSIEAMGQAVAPGVALFGAAAAAAMLANEESGEEAELPSTDFDSDAADADELDVPSNEPAAAAEDDSEAASVALNLDDDLSASLEADGDATPDAELELPDLDMNLDESASTDVPPASSEADLGDSSLDLDLDGLDLNLDDQPESAQPEANVADAAVGGDEGLEFSLDDATAEADIPEDASAEPVVEGGEESEFDVKLDLAQAYLEMGEPDLAKGLLDEVVEGGNDTQRSSAEKLLQDID